MSIESIRLPKYETKDVPNSESPIDVDAVVTLEKKELEETRTTAPIDVLREDIHYDRVVKTVDYVGQLGDWINKLEEDVLLEGDVQMRDENERLITSDQRVSQSHRRKLAEISDANQQAEARIAGPVRTMNMVVNDFKRRCDDVQRRSEFEYAKFSDDFGKLQAEMELIRNEYSEIISQSTTIHANLDSEKNAIQSSLNELVTPRAALILTDEEYAEFMAKIEQIDRQIDSIKRSQDAQGSSVANDTIKSLQSERVRISAAATKNRKGPAASHYNDIRELSTAIDESGKRAAKLHIESSKLRDRAKELVAEAESISTRAASMGEVAVTSISGIEVEGAPDVLNNQLITAAIVVNNPEAALKTIRRSRPDLVGAAAAESKLSVQHVVSSAPAEHLVNAIITDNRRHGEVLSRIVNNEATRPYDSYMLRDILEQNGMSFPDDFDVMQEFGDFYASVQKTKGVTKPAVLRGGEVRARRN